MNTLGVPFNLEPNPIWKRSIYLDGFYHTYPRFSSWALSDKIIGIRVPFRYGNSKIAVGSYTRSVMVAFDYDWFE